MLEAYEEGKYCVVCGELALWPSKAEPLLCFTCGKAYNMGVFSILNKLEPAEAKKEAPSC